MTVVSGMFPRSGFVAFRAHFGASACPFGGRRAHFSVVLFPRSGFVASRAHFGASACPLGGRRAHFSAILFPRSGFVASRARFAASACPNDITNRNSLLEQYTLVCFDRCSSLPTVHVAA